MTEHCEVVSSSDPGLQKLEQETCSQLQLCQGQETQSSHLRADLLHSQQVVLLAELVRKFKTPILGPRAAAASKQGCVGAAVCWKRG